MNINIDEHVVKIDLDKIEYRLGVSYKEAMDAMSRTINGLYDIIEMLQKRVLELELKVDDLNE